MQDKPTRNILSGGVVDLQLRARRSNFCEVNERDDFKSRSPSPNLAAAECRPKGTECSRKQARPLPG